MLRYYDLCTGKESVRLDSTNKSWISELYIHRYSMSCSPGIKTMMARGKSNTQNERPYRRSEKFPSLLTRRLDFAQ